MREHFSLFDFGTWFNKSMSRASKSLAKIGEGKLLHAATKSLSSAKKKAAGKTGSAELNYREYSQRPVFPDVKTFERVEAAGADDQNKQ